MLIIEERNTENREAFFNCIDVLSGKIIFRSFQFEEKFWIGIEAVYNGIIYFNKYLKPDMPQHKGILAFKINTQEILWELPDHVFMFINDNRIYAFIQQFELRIFFSIDCITGELREENSLDSISINELKNNSIDNQLSGQYKFPVRFFSEYEEDESVKNLLNEYKSNNVTAGYIEYIKHDRLLLMNSFEPDDTGTFSNIFKTVEIESGKVIFKEVLTTNCRSYVPDSFFMQNNLIFLLRNKDVLLVCSVKK